jgi:hypothetical protein
MLTPNRNQGDASRQESTGETRSGTSGKISLQVNVSRQKRQPDMAAFTVFSETQYC